MAVSPIPEVFLSTLLRYFPVESALNALSTLLNRHHETPIYEVLAYHVQLELLDEHGEQAHYTKSQKVRFLQDNVIAYQDQAYGDGDIFVNYQCSPGVPVDYYQDGNVWRVLISLRETKRKGQVEDIHISRTIKNGYTESVSYLQTNIEHPTQFIEMSIIFPATRLPRRVVGIRKNTKHSVEFGLNAFTDLPDQRQKIVWHVRKPKRFESYILKWEW